MAISNIADLANYWATYNPELPIRSSMISTLHPLWQYRFLRGIKWIKPVYSIKTQTIQAANIGELVLALRGLEPDIRLYRWSVKL